MIDRRRRRLGAALAALPVSSLAFPGLALAQAKPISIVLTVPPGTSIDALARTLGEKVRARTGRTVVVESKPGGGGAIAVQALKNAPADGSVLMLAPTSSISMHALFASVPSFDPDKDLDAVCEVAASPHTITVNRAMGVNTFQEYVEHVRKNPALQSIGTPSLAGLATLMIYQMRKTLGVGFQHVPYKGGQPLLADLLGNQVPAAASVLADYLPEHRAGRIKVLVHASAARSPLAPEIPTFKELGYPFHEARTTFGFFARKGTPQPVLEESSRVLSDSVNLPDVVAKLNALGLSPTGGTPAAYAAAVRNDARQWGPLAAESGLKIN